MPSILLRLSATLLFFALSSAALADECYVIGDTSKNKLSKPEGSAQNPYSSLAAVEADSSCDTIIVLYSDVVLNGGINLRDGQELRGRPGPRKALPIISNTTAINSGYGVQLAANNSIASLHIRDTQNSAVNGDNVGKLSIQNCLITRFGLSEDLQFFPPGFPITPPGVTLLPAEDVKIRISDTELGDANSTSILIIPFAGHADIVIEGVAVRDQGHVAGAEITPGIVVFGLGASSVDLKVQNTSVSNIGADLCNCDGMVFFALQSSMMEVLVDGYSYVNPDGDGGDSATGLEIGNFFGTGASFVGEVRNSLIDSPVSIGIQVIDQQGDVGGNSLDVYIHDNEIYDAGSGIELGIGLAPNGTDRVMIENNLIVNPGFAGISFFSFISQQTLVDMLIQKNTIINAGFFGLSFSQQVGASVTSLNLDAGGGLGSQGKNRIIGSQVADIHVATFDFFGFPPTPPFTVDAANNWWGSDTGPATVFQIGGATVDVTPFLTEDPED